MPAVETLPMPACATLMSLTCVLSAPTACALRSEAFVESSISPRTSADSRPIVEACLLIERIAASRKG